jgi:uncharacterized membrane protein
VQFPAHFKHDHPAVRNVNQIYEERLTRGDRVADRFAAIMGSWSFIIIQSILLLTWVVLNVAAWVMHWDPYPFILLNLALSFQAAYAAPIIMMSQNRQAAKDRLEAHHDFEVNTKAEEEVRVILEHLEAQSAALHEVLERLERLEAQA